MEWSITASVLAVILGSFGWSHASLRTQIRELEKEIMRRPTDEELRQTIEDQLAPHQVEYEALSYRLEELKLSQRELDRKLEKVLELCTRINNEKN